VTISGGTSQLEVVESDDRHAPAIAEFIRAIWNPEATPESVVRSRADGAVRNLAEPGVPPPTFIALQGGRVLGYVTSIPIRLWDGRLDWPAYLIKGLMVHPDFRNGPIGYLVLKAAVRRLPRSGALAVAPAARRLFEALGYRDLGAIPNWVRPVALHRILGRMEPVGLGVARLPRWAPQALRFAQSTGLAAAAGRVAGAALRASAAALRIPALALETGPFDPAGNAAELDGLWKNARAGLASTVVRDSRYLIQRYGTEADGTYHWLGVRKAGSLAGMAVLRRPRSDGDARLRGIRVAALADILYAPGDAAAGLALLGAVERTARSLGADAILATTPSPALGSLLRRQWYFPMTGNVHFLLRDVQGDPTALGPSLVDWWLTRGDGSADEIF
jgi:predicted N-acetyltransferase YhbS